MINLCQYEVLVTTGILIMVSMIEPTNGQALVLNLSALQKYFAPDSCEAQDRLVATIAPMAIISS